MAETQFFKRYRMEIPLGEFPLPQAVLPEGYFWREWHISDLERHAATKFRSFRDELDAEVFSDIARQERFLELTTWLISYARQEEFPQDCGTIQGIGAAGESGAIQNIGVVPEHRGLGLGRALLLKSLEGFRMSGVKRVVLEVTASNLIAVELYRQLGFRITRTMYRTAPIEESGL